MKLSLGPIFAGAILAAGLAAPVYAALPALPGPNNKQGPDKSIAANPGDNGGALEPYLITLLLPVGGIVMAVAGIGMDRLVRSRGGG